jgi:hypothetical protein
MGPMPNKLECSFMASFFSLIWVMPRAYTCGLEHAALVQATTLLTNISLGWKGLPGTNPLAYLVSLSVMKNITLTPGDVAGKV